MYIPWLWIQIVSSNTNTSRLTNRTRKSVVVREKMSMSEGLNLCLKSYFLTHMMKEAQWRKKFHCGVLQSKSRTVQICVGSQSSSPLYIFGTSFAIMLWLVNIHCLWSRFNCVLSMLSTQSDWIQPGNNPVRVRDKQMQFRVLGTHCRVQFEVLSTLIYTRSTSWRA